MFQEKKRKMEVMKTGWTARSRALGPGGQVGSCRRLTSPGGSRKQRRTGGCCPTSLRTSRCEQPWKRAPCFYATTVLSSFWQLHCCWEGPVAKGSCPTSKKGRQSINPRRNAVHLLHAGVDGVKPDETLQRNKTIPLLPIGGWKE